MIILEETETIRISRRPCGDKKKEQKLKCANCDKTIYATACIIRRAIKEGRKNLCGTCSRSNNGLKHSHEYGEASFKDVYNGYVIRSKNRQLEWDISEAEFRVLTQENCYYCGSIPSSSNKKKKLNGHYVYNGLDRMDSSKGYILENVVPCCKNCNLAKRDTYVVDFLAMIERIHDLQAREKILKKLLDRKAST